MSMRRTARLLGLAGTLLANLAATQAAAQVWTQFTPSSPATSLKYHTMVSDAANDRVIVFGGLPAVGCYPVNDVWVLTHASGLTGTPAWIQLAPTGTKPAARWEANAVYDAATNRMIVFGGITGGACSGTPPLSNEVWVLTHANGLGGTPQWIHVFGGGSPPSGRAWSSAVYDAAYNRMLVFGGNRSVGNCSIGMVSNETYALSNANGLANGQPMNGYWYKPTLSGVLPAARWAHAAVYEAATDRMVVFGGSLDACNSLSSGVFVLTRASHSAQSAWVGVGSAPPSVASSGSTAVLDTAGNRMIVFGGGTATAIKNDVWVMTGIDGSTPATWNQLMPTGPLPPVRSGHGAVYDALRRVMIVYGGEYANNDPKVWVLSIPPPADTIPPVLTLPGNITEEGASSAGAIVGYVATANDNVDGAVTPSCAPASGSLFPLGMTPVSCTARDAAGNTANGSFTVTVVDTMPPSLTLPVPISTLATGANGAVVTFTATATDLVDGPVTPTCTPASGSTFPVGTTSVTCTAKDMRNNTVSGSFNVVVARTTWGQLGAAGPAPIARHRHSAVYDPGPNRMIIFGGQAPTSGCVLNPLNDTWVLTNANSLGGAPAWSQLVPSGSLPQARGAHSAAYDAANDRMIVFGGNSTGCAPPQFNDVWVLGGASGTHGTPLWTQLTPAGTPPPGLAGSTAVYDATRNKLIVFGGNLSEGYCSNITNNVWTLSNANGLGGTPAWTQLSPSGTRPAARWYSTAVYDSLSDRMTIFGGSDTCTTGYNDAWVLSGIATAPAWTQLSPTGSLPAQRETKAVYDATQNRMMIFGGSYLNDTWVLQNANGMGSPGWTQAQPPAPIPVGRSLHSAVYDPGSQRMTIFGGSGATSLLNDVWILSSSTVSDTTPPVLTLPAPITEQAASPAGAIVSYVATANDNVDGALIPGCAPVSGSLFALGTTTVDCTATDAAGNTANGNFTVTVSDTMPPSLTLPAPITTEATGPAGAMVTFSATATDAVDGVRPVTCMPASGSTFAFGTTPVTCSASDSRDNAVSASFNVVVTDTTKPALTLPSNIVTEATSAAGAVVVFSATAADLVTAIPTVVCTPASGSTFNISGTTVTCEASDGAGNTATGNFAVTVVDTTRPAVSFVSPVPDAIISSSPVTVAVQVADAVGVASVTINGTTATQTNGTWQASVPVTLPVAPGGALTFSAVAVDFSVNTGSASETVDNDGIAGAVDKNRSTAADESGVYSNDFNDGATSGTIVNRAGWDARVDDLTGPDGVRATIAGAGTGTAVVRACSGRTKDVWLDVAGETVDLTCGGGTLTVRAVAATPTIQVNKRYCTGFRCRTVRTTLMQGRVIWTGSPVTADPSNVGPTLVELVDENDVVFGSFQLDPGESVNVEFVDGPNGQTAVEITVLVGSVTFDISGQTFTLGAGESRTIVEDLLAPEIGAVGDIVAEATSAAGAVVSFSLPTVTDDADPAPVVTASPASGSVFSIGTATVTVTATDAAGRTSTKTFTVTVSDTTPPVLSLPADITAEAAGPGGIVVTYSATANDAIDGARPVACTPESGSAFPLGTTSVACSASDTHGNTASGTFTVTVQDTTPPSLTVPANVTAEAAGPAGATVSFAVTASDAVTLVPLVTATPPSGSQFPLGTTLVTVTARDAAGNTSTMTFTVTVQDTTPPVIAAHANEVAEATSSGGAPVNYVPPVWTDAVSGTGTATCVPAPGTMFSIGTSTVACTAADRAGNRATPTSFTVTVRVTPAGLRTLVMGFVTQPGIANSMVSKLNAAEAAAARGNAQAKAGAIRAFINELQAQSGKSLTAAQAATLIALAQLL